MAVQQQATRVRIRSQMCGNATGKTARGIGLALLTGADPVQGHDFWQRFRN